MERGLPVKLPPTAAVLVTLCALATNRVAAQAVRYVSQERSARSFLYERYEQYDDEDPAELITVSEFATAQDFGDFSVSALAEPDMGRHRTGISWITQESRLAPGGIFTSGFSQAYTTSDTGYFEFETITAATFDVTDGPLRYLLDYRVDYPDPVPGTMQNGLALRRADGSGASVFDVALDFQDQPWGYSAVGALDGELSPGRYEFRFFDLINSDESIRGRYDVSLRFSPVPEPSSGAAWIVGAGVMTARRRRRSQVTVHCLADVPRHEVDP